MGAPEETGPPEGQWEWHSASRGRVVTTPAGERPTVEGLDDWILLTNPEHDREQDA